MRSWVIRDGVLTLTRPLVMGVLNVTPDSFYEGSRCFGRTEEAVSQALRMLEAGADLIDIGGESSRPGSSRVTEDEELRRVIPVVEKVASSHGACTISIDTCKAAVAREAAAAGARVINDISAGRLDERLLGVVAETGCGYVLMHMQGTPETMQVAPRYDDPVGEVRQFFELGMSSLAQVGIDSSRVVLDPGIGFGKRLEDNLALLAHASALRCQERPLLYGLSRKSFLGSALGRDTADRLNGTTAAHMFVLMQGVDILRVHDVEAAVDTVRLFLALEEAGSGN